MAMVNVFYFITVLYHPQSLKLSLYIYSSIYYYFLLYSQVLLMEM